MGYLVTQELMLNCLCIAEPAHLNCCVEGDFVVVDVAVLDVVLVALLFLLGLVKQVGLHFKPCLLLIQPYVKALYLYYILYPSFIMNLHYQGKLYLELGDCGHMTSSVIRVVTHKLFVIHSLGNHHHLML